MSRVIHFKSEDDVIWSVTHTEAAHYVILKGDKPYRYAYWKLHTMLYLREINHTDTHTEAAHYVILKGDIPYSYAYWSCTLCIYSVKMPKKKYI